MAGRWMAPAAAESFLSCGASSDSPTGAPKHFDGDAVVHAWALAGLESLTAAVACVASFGRRFAAWALEHEHVQTSFVQVLSLSRYCVSRSVQAFIIHFMFSLAACAWFTRFLINVSLVFFGLHLSFIRTRKHKSKPSSFAFWCWMTKCEDLLLKYVATWIANEALTDSGTSLFAMVYLNETLILLALIRNKGADSKLGECLGITGSEWAEHANQKNRGSK